MKILSVNAGSSSLKFTLFEMPEGLELISGNFEKIGFGNSFYTIKVNGEKNKVIVVLNNHEEAVNYLTQELIKNKIINSLDEIDGIGHRIVSGGQTYNKSIVISDEFIATFENLFELAPLHNPANLIGIKTLKNILPNTPMIGVFDTAFHQTMKETEFLYPVPYEWYEKYSVRKYGFHGTSHRYVNKKICEHLNNNQLKVITCHLGNGSSITAINAGEVVDTSMGFTPLVGVMMGTRSGDIDASIIPYIMKKENKSVEEVMDDLNKKSGFLGLSGISNDSRDIENEAALGNQRCILTQEIGAKKIANYIAMYNNLLDGADVICFTAGIGENSSLTRSAVVNNLHSLGLVIDEQANQSRGTLIKISNDSSKIQMYVVPTNEELMIAIDTYELIS